MFLFLDENPKGFYRYKQSLRPMSEKRQKIIDKIEDLNQARASIRQSLQSLEERKKEISEKKYERLKEKYNKRLEKIKKKIHELEMQLK